MNERRHKKAGSSAGAGFGASPAAPSVHGPTLAEKAGDRRHGAFPAAPSRIVGVRLDRHAADRSRPARILLDRELAARAGRISPGASREVDAAAVRLHETDFAWADGAFASAG